MAEYTHNIIQKNVKDLIFADYNPRQLTEKQYKNLRESIERFGMVDPILINKNESRKNVIIGGHQRVKVAKRLRLKQVPCLELDLTLEKEKELNIRLNKNTGQWDYDVLANNFDIDELIDWGFTHDELIIPDPDPEDGLTDPDAIPEVKESRVKRGDVWTLGEHKVMCGDSTKAEDVEKLIGKSTIDLIFTDPPYGVSYTGTSGESTKEWDPIKGDDLRDDKLYEFLSAAFNYLSAYTKEGIPMYVFHASSTQIEFQKALEQAGFRIKQQLIWQKGMVLSRSDYHWTHEPLFYCVKGEKNNLWYGDRTHRTITNQQDIDYSKLNKKELIEILNSLHNNKTVWDIKKDAAIFYKHPTQKPVALGIKAMRNNTKPGDVVIDNFSGSGSTLIGAEMTKRKCLAMEYDPGYCDVILKRWEEFTGNKAKLI